MKRAVAASARGAEPLGCASRGSLAPFEWRFLGLRYFPDVQMKDSLVFAIISATAAVGQGVAIPTVLWLLLRRLKKREALKDATSQYVFGMLYNDFEADYWWPGELSSRASRAEVL